MRCKHCSKTFRTPPVEMRKTQICSECRGITQNNVDVEDIEISKGQARVLKSIARSIGSKELSEFSLRKALRDKTETLHFINDNWGNMEHFIKLALDQKNTNPISLILYFLNLRKKIDNVPTKEKMKEISKFHLSEYEYGFGSWEKFLDLLGFDPWYRENTTQKGVTKLKKSKTTRIEKITITQNSIFDQNDSLKEIIEKVNNLRIDINVDCDKKDSEESYPEYSYKESFQLLEEFLNMLPYNKKYDDVNYFL